MCLINIDEQRIGWKIQDFKNLVVYRNGYVDVLAELLIIQTVRGFSAARFAGVAGVDGFASQHGGSSLSVVASRPPRKIELSQFP